MKEEKNKVAISIVQAISGAAIDPKFSLKALSYTIQEALAGRLMSGFMWSWNELRMKGKINENYPESVSGIEALKRLIDMAKSDGVDEYRFEAVRNIFLNAAQMSDAERDNARILKIMDIAASLTYDQIMVLKSTAKYNSLQQPDRITPESEWSEFVCDDTRLLYRVWVRDAASAMHGTLMRYEGSHGGGAKVTNMGEELIKLMSEPI